MNPLFNNLIFGSSINGNILSLLKKALTPVKAPQETIPYNGKSYEKLPLLEPDTKPKTYGPYNLPGITVEAPNLNKNYRFPYGGINVISKSINGGLDHRQKVVLNPFEGHENENLPTKKGLFKKGGVLKYLFGGSNKVNRFVSEPYPQLTPEISVYSKKPYRFDRRIQNTGPGHLVISDILWGEYKNGEFMGDASGIMGGRTIYTSPKGNDTIYMDPIPTGYGMSSNAVNWIEYPHGAMPVPSNNSNQTRNKSLFLNNLRKSYVRSYDKESKPAFNRALKGYQSGGELRVDNTRVASGRPQQIENKIPYGAGKGQAGEFPINTVLNTNITKNPNVLTGMPIITPARFSTTAIPNAVEKVAEMEYRIPIGRLIQMFTKKGIIKQPKTLSDGYTNLIKKNIIDPKNVTNNGNQIFLNNVSDDLYHEYLMFKEGLKNK